MPGTFSQIYIQVVFAVKGRENLISNNWKTDLHKYISAIIKGKEQKPIIVNGMPDHIHAFIGLRPAMAIADIVSEKPLATHIVCNATLWASCIGGAAQQDEYRDAIEKSGLQVVTMSNNNQYAFISNSARGASKQFDVKSVSLLARKSKSFTNLLKVFL